MSLKTGRLDGLLGHLLRHAFLTGQRAFHDAYPDRTITPLSYGAFELIRLNPGVSHKAVSSRLKVATSVLTTALKPYLIKGYITQSPNAKDRRVVEYKLSKGGENWFQSISDDIRNAEIRLSQGLSVEEVDQLKQLLNKLVDGAAVTKSN
ncbi:MAG: hypothetical protein K8F25_09175 [Fimbriimonadaceae bacterium]|nr:hypothetical protein [Alphaproteobacteria bacterium]